MIRPILRYGDRGLATAAAPVTQFDDDLVRLIDDMVETMYAAPGIGLAATQIGIPLRVFVVDLSVGKANGELQRLATGKGVKLPTEPDAKARREQERLGKLTGASFDLEYMKHMVSDHRDDVSDFRSAAKSAKDPDVKRASQSVVRVTGIACGLGVEGSGWVARRGLVVTNAHVVAGVARPRVDTAQGRAFVSEVVVFDVANDLAVLRVHGLGAAALPLGQPERGVAVALVGYPQNGPLTRTPARLGGTATVLSRDAYGKGPVRRQMTTIRGAVEPGSSGGPGVDAQGRVRTTVFARRPRETGGYGIPSDLVGKVLVKAAGARPVGETDCAA